MKTNWRKEEKEILERINNGEDFTSNLGLNVGGGESEIRSFHEYCKKKNSPLVKDLELYLNKRYKSNPVLWIFLSLLVIADILMGIFYGFWVLVPLILIELFSAFIGAYIMILMENEAKDD